MCWLNKDTEFYSISFNEGKKHCPLVVSKRMDLSDDLIGTLDEDLHGPPVVVSHPVQKPLRVGEMERESWRGSRGWVTGADRKKQQQEKWSRAETSQAAWLLLNCLVSNSIHCSMVGWRRKHSGKLALTQEAAKASYATAELQHLTFSLEWMNVSRTNDVLSWKILIVIIVFTDATITSKTDESISRLIIYCFKCLKISITFILLNMQYLRCKKI